MRALVTTFVLALAIGLVLGSTAPIDAQDWAGRGRVIGTVLDPDGNPVEGAKITLQAGPEEGNGPAPLTTNKKGKWSYLGLTGGRWIVKIEVPGYLISEGVFPINQFSANPPIIVNLKPIPEEVLREARGNQIMGILEEGNALLAEGKNVEARASYEMALLDLDPEGQPFVLMGIARSYYSEGDMAKTEETLVRALEINPDYVDALKLISSLLLRAEGREADAAAYMARLPEGEVLFADDYLNLGIDYYNKKDNDKALIEFDKVVENFPDNADAYYYRGLVLLQQGENERSASDFMKLLELQPDGPRTSEAKEFLEYLQPDS